MQNAACKKFQGHRVNEEMPNWQQWSTEHASQCKFNLLQTCSLAWRQQTPTTSKEKKSIFDHIIYKTRQFHKLH